MNYQTMAGVIFLRFYCPTIIFPAKYSLIPTRSYICTFSKSFFRKSSQGSYGAKNSNYCFQGATNTRQWYKLYKNFSYFYVGGEFEPTKTHSPVIDKFLAEKSSEMIEFVKALLVT
jgi:hypothetical protein